MGKKFTKKFAGRFKKIDPADELDCLMLAKAQLKRQIRSFQAQVHESKGIFAPKEAKFSRERRLASYLRQIGIINRRLRAVRNLLAHPDPYYE